MRVRVSVLVHRCPETLARPIGLLSFCRAVKGLSDNSLLCLMVKACSQSTRL